jgi:hypothetical protein
LNKEKNSRDLTKLEKITTLEAHSGEFDPYQRYLETKEYKSISDEITLEADQYYYTEIYHINGGGPGYFGAGVIIPNDGAVQPNSFVEI